MIQRVALAIKPYASAYYGFIAGVGVGIIGGTLICAYTIRVLIERLT